MFTLTISDKPVAITNADEDEARELLMSEDFKDDLKVLESEGAPLWDGFATLTVRAATEEEKNEFENADFDDDEDDDDGEEGPYIMFLVDVTDPDELEEEP
ncbi:hypothetical protein [Microvirga lotononidis]|uniref:Uncharacterized protein n=1 Tax=Microvirga lotononidis TaxID=864069 RepID=I4YKS7_9HYPH|nr:hypothetical protein [Microvirga lotononidis]EIM24569.1 hypothetical protein MicloDRAFT_00052840 [Microvirga lotononidis]WQO26588.1 hypothetical protein U0023_18190 [Microvirga lotononidis]